MFERGMPGPIVIDPQLPFEERVERAWRHIKATRFTEDEHERLRTVVVGLIEADQDPSRSKSSHR
jgi:hypothetical protein